MRLDEERFYIEKDGTTYNFDRPDIVWIARTEFKKVIEDGFTEEEENFFIKELESIKTKTDTKKSMAIIPDSMGSWYEADYGVFNSTIAELFESIRFNDELLYKYNTIFNFLKINTNKNQHILCFWDTLINRIITKNNIKKTNECYTNLIDKYIQVDLGCTLEQWKDVTKYNNDKIIELYKENALYSIFYKEFKGYVNLVYNRLIKMDILV